MSYTMRPKVIAVDFDGTLCKNAWPDIGEPYEGMIEDMKNLRRHGDKVILWTCREGEKLQEAVDWCAQFGLTFDAVNDNTEEQKKFYGGNCRKIMADVYIDDKAWEPRYE